MTGPAAVGTRPLGRVPELAQGMAGQEPDTAVTGGPWAVQSGMGLVEQLVSRVVEDHTAWPLAQPLAWHRAWEPEDSPASAAAEGNNRS